MTIQTTLSFEDPKLRQYMAMFADLKENYEESPKSSNYGDMSNGYTEDVERIYDLYSSGLQLKDVTLRLYETSCFYYLERSYKKYILKEVC